MYEFQIRLHIVKTDVRRLLGRYSKFQTLTSSKLDI